MSARRIARNQSTAAVAAASVDRGLAHGISETLQELICSARQQARHAHVQHGRQRLLDALDVPAASPLRRQA